MDDSSQCSRNGTMCKTASDEKPINDEYLHGKGEELDNETIAKHPSCLSDMHVSKKSSDSNDDLFLCLKENEKVGIEMMAKTNIRIRLIIEEVIDIDNDEMEKMEFHRNSDLIVFSAKKVADAVFATEYNEEDSAMYMNMSYDQNEDVAYDSENDFMDVTDDCLEKTSGTPKIDLSIEDINEKDSDSKETGKTGRYQMQNCKLCGKMFVNIAHFENHLKMHKEECFEDKVKRNSHRSNSEKLNSDIIKNQEEVVNTDSINSEDVNSQKRNRIEGLVESLRSQKMSTVSDGNDSGFDISYEDSPSKVIKPAINMKNKSIQRCKICGKEFLYHKPFQKHMEMHGSSNPIHDSGNDQNDSVYKRKSRKAKVDASLTTYDSMVLETKKDFKNGESTFENNLLGYHLSASEDDFEKIETGDTTEESDDNSKDPDFVIGKNTRKNTKKYIKTKSKKVAENEKQSMLEPKDQMEENGVVPQQKTVINEDLNKSQVQTKNNKRGRPRKTQIENEKEKKKYNKTIDELNLPKEKSGLYRCGICGKTFTQNGSRKEHMNTHNGVKPFKCKLCPKSYCWSGNLRGHIKRVHQFERPYQCTVCGNGYIERNQLNKHMRIHSGDKPFECKVCGRRFIQQSSLRNHSVLHTGLKLHSCKICGKKFSLAGYVREHMKIHSEQRNYVCDICGKQYTRGEHLKVHKSSVHAVDKPFSCEECGKTFSASFRLRMHMLTHTKPVICEICGKSFTSTSGLKAHMPMHTGAKPYECEHCGKKFRWYGGYKKHRWLHLGYRQHGCNICGKRFSMKKNYLDHMNTHTGEKPYKCKLCKSKFGHYSCLRRHYKNLHTLNMQDIKEFPERVKTDEQIQQVVDCGIKL